MSLFSAGPSAAAAPPAPAVSLSVLHISEVYSFVLIFCTSQSNAWGGAGVWGAPATAPAPAATASNDIWGSFTSAQPASASNNSIFGGVTSTQPQSQAVRLFSIHLVLLPRVLTWWSQTMSNVWGAPAPAAPSFGGNVWGSSGTTSSGGDLFGSFGGAGTGSSQQPAPAAKKDDAFGDLWS